MIAPHLNEEFLFSLVRFFFLFAVLLQAIEEMFLERITGAELLPNQREMDSFYGLRQPITVSMIGVIRFASVIWCILDSTNLAPVLVLLFATLMRSLRFFGSLNGGSDSMTQVILIPLVLARVFHENMIVVRAVLYWIGIQAVLSYFLSGLRKARNHEWWSGSALVSFVSESRVAHSGVRRIFLSQMKTSRFFAILVVLFELGFPLSLASREVCFFFLSAGAIFHLGVFFLLGLNRFFWIWLAGYPAIYFIASFGRS
ncbi:MAG: hypothetical protein KGP28_03965 [Bdellovibrionales bacterium]|nr:hypothetical protein [Bdellovibrionales bacterium]